LSTLRWLTATHLRRGGEVTVMGLVAASLLALGSGPVIGQTIDTKLGTVTSGGGINDIVRVGNTIYISGGFLQVGPCTGQGVPVSATTGRPSDVYPRVVGEVAVAAADGHGGWFIGGSFGSVAGSARRFLARILADGSLSAWDPQPNAPVEALCLSGDTLYVGGSFTACGGASRRYGAAFDVRTGALRDWDPKANAAIKAIATDGIVVYIGGQFSALDTLQRACLAGVDRGTGTVTDWNPGADSVVLALAVRGDEVYAGGYFHHVGGAPRSLIAAIDRLGGTVLPWSWTIVRSPGCDPCDPGPFVDALAIEGTRLYFGGSFTHIDGNPRSGAAAMTLSSHEVSNWDPQLTGAGPFPYCRAVAISQGVVYLGGQFDGLKGITRPHAGAVDTNGVLTGWNPRPNAEVRSVAAGGTSAYIGGDFGSVWSWQPRRFLASLDATTGEVTPWNPNPNNVVGPIRVSGNTVYVAGAFETIAGQPRTCLAALDAQSGQATPWNPGVEAGIYPPVRDIVVRHGIVYVAGLFSGLGGQPRYCLGAVDSVTGEATSWYPQVDDFVETMTMQGDTLYLGGWFSQVAGVPRNYLAAVDTSGTLLDWNPGPNSIVQTLTVAQGRVFIGGGFTSVSGLPRNTLAAIDCATGAVTDWIADANPQVRCLAVANDVLYAGGWFRQVAGEARNGLAAIDTQTGALLSWNPRPDPGFVSALHVGGDALYVGGSFDYLGLELRPGLAAVSLARGADPGPVPTPGRLLAVGQNAPNPVRASTTIQFGLSVAARVTLSVFDLAGRCIATPVKEVEQPAGPHQVELRASGWPSGVYYYRIEAAGATAVRKMVVVK
jgi:type IX secretion system substrate protein/beta-propeller uncharacterized protein DUF5122